MSGLKTSESGQQYIDESEDDVLDGIVATLKGLDKSIAESFPGHRGRLGKIGGSLPKGATHGVEDIARAEAIADKIMEREGVTKEFAKIREKIKASLNTKDIYSKDGVYTPERQALHDKIMKGLLGDTTPSDTPSFIMTGGLPGAGKSSVLEKQALLNYVKLDGDSVKMQLPEYKGWNASNVEKEAEDIIVSTFKFATRTRRNIVFDGTMEPMEKYKRLTTAMKKHGYQTKAIYVDVPMKVSIEKAIRRFHRMGRFVDPLYIASNDAHNIKTFNTLKSMVDHYEHYDKNKRLIQSDKPFKESMAIFIDESFPDHAGRPGKVGGSLPKGGASSVTPVAPTEEEIKKYSDLVAKIKKDLGVEDMRVVINWENRITRIGGVEFQTGGRYNPDTGIIEMYVAGLKDEMTAKGILSHEIQHHRWKTAMADYELDQVKAELTPEYVHPTYDKLSKYLEVDGSMHDKLNKEDGHTTYAKTHWSNINTDPLNIQHNQRYLTTAYDETLAEIARLNSNGEADKVSATWKAFYKDINDVYDRIKRSRVD